ncbi:CopD family protein [Yoonia sp.]|uniref:CopD family protein n=1 Tax=Yoonia sp. TaxID=2212373 RepID=UPI002FDA26D0
MTLVPIFKSVHIAALLIWCSGLLILPVMLARHEPAIGADDYTHIRRAAHITYTLVVTPAAVVAVIAGTWLIFLREVFVPWFYAKMVFVAILVALHAWIGHILVLTAEEPTEHTPPSPVIPTGGVLLAVIAILCLVLAKPAADWLEMPDWLLEPRGYDFPFDVPS